MKDIFISQTQGYIVEFDTTGIGINYQLIYTTEVGENFNNEKSVYYTNENNNAGFKHNKVVIPTNEKIINFRIDYGSYPGNFKIKNVKIKSTETTNIELTRLVSGFNEAIDSYELNDDYLEINSLQVDPYSIINDLNISPKNIYNVNFVMLFVITTLIIVILSFIEYIYKLINAKQHTVVAIYFIVLMFIIYTPMLFMNFDEIDVAENRTLATFPKIYVDNEFNTQFTSQFESWFNDRFGFRKYYLTVDRVVSRVFQPNRIENDKALLGKDQWLFYTAGGSVENYQGITLLSEEELQKAVDVILEKMNGLNLKVFSIIYI